jgi:hypothetical protein
MEHPDVPVITLSNGVRVANFSSPHTFTFVDGRVLPACSAARAQETKLEAIERTTANFHAIQALDIHLSWGMTNTIHRDLCALSVREDIDVVLVPFPVMTALKDAGIAIGKARVIRVADRVTKMIHIDRFCA